MWHKFLSVIKSFFKNLLQLNAVDSSENSILLEVERQALLHIILEKLADHFHQKEKEIADVRNSMHGLLDMST